jgi:hypothetical protein
VGITVDLPWTAIVAGEASIPQSIAPGAEAAAEFDLALVEENALTVSRVNVRTTGTAVRPALMQLIVEHVLPSLPATTSIAQLGQAMQDQPWIMVHRPQSPHVGETRRVHVADVKLALRGDAMAILARVQDSKITITKMLWDGSSVEVYGCSPDRERIGHVFGNIEIGQVFLTPACGDRPARGYSFINNSPIEMPDITVASRPIDGGYELSALVPLPRLAVAADADRLMFELMAQSGPHADGQQRRATLFGSFTAFNNSSSYAMIVRGG